MFGKVLIANRGEIVCRVSRTLGEMGIASAGVYHDADRHSGHLAAVDEAHEITGETPVAAHLDGGQLIDLALRVGADAIHPGYGFLSENAQFAEAVASAGLTFIGPDAASIRLMGDKLRSRAFAAEHGVPVAPSVEPTSDMDAFVAEASGIGFPLLVKASAGGGGKGMSIVRSADELAGKAALAAGEAERYFADGRIYAERYVERPRHIEVQVMGDGAGNVVHLFERDCSVQRRFQKIIEEAPAPDLDDGLRQQIIQAGVTLAAAANYLNAGTVEFILAPDGAFYFLEMNTRLQVEHPVTELITGLDLVRMQIEIAAGQGLSVTQDQITATGHAIECRICAEDPENDFLPETGRIERLRAPSGAGVRLDSALSEGQPVTADFDPMLAKLIVHAQDRTAACASACNALGDLTLLGVGTNTDYLMRVIAHDAFATGAVHTGLLSEAAGDLTGGAQDEEHRDAALVAMLLGEPGFCALLASCPEPYASIGHWRN